MSGNARIAVASRKGNGRPERRSWEESLGCVKTLDIKEIFYSSVGIILLKPVRCSMELWEEKLSEILTKQSQESSVNEMN